ncbi:MAG: hypothetical protein ACFE9Q_09340 [Candidatus Hodarchaeota archaeon]
MKSKNEDFLIGIITAFLFASIITMLPVWQLIIIPGIIAGLLNKTMRRAALAGGIGTLMAWSLYMISGLILKNVYLIFNQFGALILGAGFGWLLIIIVFLMGFVFGVLGGVLGYLLNIVVIVNIRTTIERNSGEKL